MDQNRAKIVLFCLKIRNNCLGTNFGVPDLAVMSKSSKIRQETVESYWAFGEVLNLSGSVV